MICRHNARQRPRHSSFALSMIQVHATPNMQQVLLVVRVMNPQVIDSLLDDLVVDVILCVQLYLSVRLGVLFCL